MRWKNHKELWRKIGIWMATARDFYNDFIGGVNLTDQIVFSYEISGKSARSGKRFLISCLWQQCWIQVVKYNRIPLISIVDMIETGKAKAAIKQCFSRKYVHKTLRRKKSLVVVICVLILGSLASKRFLKKAFSAMFQKQEEHMNKNHLCRLQHTMMQILLYLVYIKNYIQPYLKFSCWNKSFT